MARPVGYVPQGYNNYGYNRRPTNREDYREWFRKLQIKVRVALTNPSQTAKQRLDAAIRLIPE